MIESAVRLWNDVKQDEWTSSTNLNMFEVNIADDYAMPRFFHVSIVDDVYKSPRYSANLAKQYQKKVFGVTFPTLEEFVPIVSKYILILKSDKYKIEPINVLITPTEDGVIISNEELGVFCPGRDRNDAIENLKEFIISDYEYYQNERELNLSEKAIQLKSIYSKYISRK